MFEERTNSSSELTHGEGFPRKIAVVLPRYGESLGGGAETLVKALIERLAVADDGPELIEVWTTCARDHRTWENHFAPGVTEEGGITVRRFPVDERDLEVFIRAELAIADGWPLGADEQLDWMRNSVNSRELYAHIAEAGREFDLLLFAPYLFATTFWGALIYPEKSVVVPCLHDENYAYLGIFRHLFSRVRGMLFNHGEEAALAAEIFSSVPVAEKGAVVGMGFDLPAKDTDAEIEAGAVKELFASGKRYLIYSGRKEAGKNLPLLIDAFEALRGELRDDSLQLVLIGAGDISFRKSLPEGVLDLGFVSEGEKRILFRNALALVQPSVNESFSIVMMEAWLERTPVIVHSRGRVTRAHVVDSGGGLYFADEAELGAVIKHLLETPGLRELLGNAGYDYVSREYSWSSVLTRFRDGVKRIWRSETDVTLPLPSSPV